MHILHSNHIIFVKPGLCVICMTSNDLKSLLSGRLEAAKESDRNEGGSEATVIELSQPLAVAQVVHSPSQPLEVL